MPLLTTPEEPDVVCKVPEVGKVIFVFPVTFPVKLKAPEKEVFPPTEIVPVFATPVPPDAGETGTVFVLRLVLFAILKSLYVVIKLEDTGPYMPHSVSATIQTKVIASYLLLEETVPPALVGVAPMFIT